ncbi:MAG: hypothetical protein ABSB84_04085 [Verrucomicrobiota bacterium]
MKTSVFDKLNQFINRSTNHVAWLLFIPVLFLQTSDSFGQGIESLAVIENIPHQFDRINKLGNPVSIRLLAWDAISSGVDCRENLGFPCFQTSNENALSSGFFRFDCMLSSFLVAPLLASFGEQMDNNPASDINRDDANGTNSRPIYWGRLRWYHWAVLLII